MTALGKALKGYKVASKLTPLRVVVEGGRTPADCKESYDAIAKLMKDKTKLPAIFKTAGLTVPKERGATASTLTHA